MSLVAGRVERSILVLLDNLEGLEQAPFLLQHLEHQVGMAQSSVRLN